MRAFKWYKRFGERSYSLVTSGEIKNGGFSFNKVFSLKIHSLASVAVVNVERREGPKSCGERSGQTDRWNRDPSVAGKRPNLTLSF